MLSHGGQEAGSGLRKRLVRDCGRFASCAHVAVLADYDQTSSCFPHMVVPASTPGQLETEEMGRAGSKGGKMTS